MQKCLRILVLMVLIVVPSAMRAQCDNGAVQCNITIEMSDSYGDGWNGNAIAVYQGTTLRGTVTLGSGSSGAATVAICSGDSVRLEWSEGSYADETSFTVTNGDGTPVGTTYAGMDYATGDVVVAFMPVCPSCVAPSGLTFSNVDASGATIAWTAGGAETAWELTIDGIATTVYSTTYVASGLTPLTNYAVSVRAICAAGDTSLALTGTFATAMGCSTALCAVEIAMTDSYGDGWNGNAIEVYDGAVLLGTATIASGASATESYSVCSGDIISLVWVAGSYASEATFSVGYGNGVAVVTNMSGSSCVGGEPIDTFQACPSCLSPTGVTVSNVTSDGADVSWTAGGAETEWVVEVNGVPDGVAYTTSYSLSNLSATTAYTVAVRSVCSTDDTSMAATAAFVTDMDCQTSMCNLTIAMEDSYGDGWNGNAIEVYSDGVLLGTATLASGGSGEQSLELCAGMPLEFRWVAGSYATETSFDIVNGDYTYIVQNQSGGSLSGGAVIAADTMACASCIPPSDLHLVYAGADSLTVAWRSMSGESEWVLTLNDSLVDAVYDTFYVFENLQPNSIYSITLRAVCDYDDTSNAVLGTYKTACGTMTLPQMTDWEDIAYNGAWPDCWTRLGWYGSDPSVNSNANHSDGGQYSMFMLAYNSHNMFASSAVPLNGNEIAVDFWLKLNSSNSSSWVQAGVMWDLSDTTTFIPLLTITDRNDTWTEYDFNTSTLSADTTYYVAFRGYGNSSWSAFAHIDDILISQLSGCQRPAAAQVDTVGYYDASLSWAAVEGESSYTVYYGTVNDFNSPDLMTATANDTTLVLQNLLPQTTYYAWVTTDCGGEESDPRPFGSFTTATTCAPVTDIEMLNLSYTAAQIRWAYDTTLGFAPVGAALTLTAVATGATTTVYTTSNEHVFAGLAAGTSYTVAIRTLCQAASTVDTAAVATINFMTSGCASIEGANSEANVAWNPVNAYYGYSYTQNLYLASEMPQIDTIWGVAFRASGSTTNRPVDVYVGHTTQTTLSTSAPIMASAMTQVATNYPMPIQQGWNVINFDNCFVYDGTSNLVVAIDNNMGSYTSNVYWYTHPTSGTQSVGTYSDGTNYDPATIGSLIYSNNNALDIQFVATCTPPACEAPFLTLGAVDSNSIVMNWVAVGGESNFEVTISNGAQTADYGVTSANSFSFQNLQANTTYTIAIGSICPNGGDTLWATMEVRTACGAMVLPYTEDFESNAVGDAPSCWELPSTYTYSNTVYPSVYSNGYASNNALRFMANGNVMAATAEIPNNGAQGDQYHIAFDARMGNYYVTATAGVLSDPADPTTYIPLVTLPTDNQWHRYNLYTVGLTASETYRFAVSLDGTYAYNNDNYTLDVDNVLIELDGGCHYPENLTATYDSVSADFSWTVTGTQQNMVLSYQPAGGAAMVVATDSDTAHHLTGLLPATTYTVRVGNICANGDTLWGLDSYMFTSACTLINLTYTQDFDAYPVDVMPPCWIWDPVYHTHWDGGAFFRSNCSSSNAIVLPKFSSPIYKTQINFDGKIKYASSGCRFLVGVTDDNGNNLQWIDTLVNADQSTSTHVPYTYRFNNYTGSGTRVAVGYLRTVDDWALIDNVVVSLIPQCLPVDSLTAHNLENPDSVWFTWTNAPDSYTQHWTVYVDTVTSDTSTIPTASLVTVNTPHYLIPQGLMQGGGKYKFYVRSNCYANLSPWTVLEVGAGQIIMSQSGTDTVTACGSVVYDNGGPIAAYYPSSSSRLVLYPSDNNNRLQVYGAYLSFYNDGNTTLTIRDGVGDGGTVLYQTSYSGPTTWYDSIVSLPLATSTTGPLTIDFTGGNYVNPGFELYVRCIPVVNCDQPTYVTATPMGYDSCMLAWYGNSQSYDVYWRPYGTTSWTVTTASTESLLLTGLTGSTTYEVQIQGLCTATDSSLMSSIYTFTTGCDAIYITATSPMVEEFEGSEVPPVCWNVVYGATANATDNPVLHDATAAYSGTKGFRFSSENSTLTGNYRQTLITPRLEGDSAMTLQFYVRASSGVENFKVGYSINGTDLSTSFIWQPEVALNANLGWMHYTLNLPQAVRYVAIDYVPSSHGYHLYVDSLVIAIADGSIDCQAPIITTSSATDTSITISYIAMGNVEAGIVEGSNWDGTAQLVNLPMVSTYTFTRLSDNTPLQQGTIYTIGLRTVCSDNENSAWEVLTIPTLSNDCDIPTDVTVSQIGSVSAVVSWNGGTAQQWEVFYTNGVNPGTVTATATSVTLTGLDRNSNYTVRVRAICGESFSEWSQPATFQSIGCITPTSLDAYSDTVQAVLTWNSSDATEWELEWGLYGSTADMQTVTVSGQPTYTLTGLTPSRTYSYRVRALCTQEEISDWSAMFHFGTADLTGIDGVNDVNVSIYPNPASNETNITLSGLSGEIAIAIIDLNGRTVRSSNILCDGGCSTTLTVTDLAAGAYFVRISGNGISQVRKLVVK